MHNIFAYVTLKKLKFLPNVYAIELVIVIKISLKDYFKKSTILRKALF